MPLRSWGGVLRMEPHTGWWPTAGMKTGVTMATSRSSVAPTSARSRTPSSTVAPWLVCPRPPGRKRWLCEALAKRRYFQWLANFDPTIEDQGWLRVDWSHPRGFWSRVWHLSAAKKESEGFAAWGGTWMTWIMCKNCARQTGLIPVLQLNLQFALRYSRNNTAGEAFSKEVQCICLQSL